MLTLHLAACAFMVGVIWLIQLVHYPAFLQINESRFGDFHHLHSLRMGWIVGPMMVFELVTGALLLMESKSDILLVLNLAGIIAIWVCTFAISVPIHNSLSRGRDQQHIEKLVRTNWPRTWLWSLRLVTLIWLTQQT